MAYRMIDLNSYPRRDYFQYFRSLSYPYAGVTADVDVTALAALCKEKGVSFYLAFMHAAALAADEVKELRQRIHAGGIAEYDECPTSHTEMKDNGTYCYCTLHHHMPFDRYILEAENARKACRETGGIQEDEDVESMYFVSTLPWISYTAMIQPVAGGDESNPRITWGRYRKGEDGKTVMPVSILAHHALVDGIHIARFYENLNEKTALIIREAKESMPG